MLKYQRNDCGLGQFADRPFGDGGRKYFIRKKMCFRNTSKVRQQSMYAYPKPKP